MWVQYWVLQRLLHVLLDIMTDLKDENSIFLFGSYYFINFVVRGHCVVL